jgi:hypothetical protein
MATPSIQTLITQAQQVLNLKSTNEIRATLAAVLANANVGTPLNPNLTTQQLWDEFYEIVRQPSDDIMSIVVDQMMRMVFSPPAPGGAGADKQVIFNDGGVLAGDSKFLWDKNANRLDVDGPVVITGDLTVDTSTLKVDSTNNRVGIGTASPSYDLQVNGATNGRIQVEGASGFGMVFIQGSSGNTAQLQLNSSGGSGKRYALSSDSTGLFGISDETASASRLTIDTSGNVNISTGNVVMTTSGKGIDFSATASGSGTMTSELLNDYEEGTWTPVLATDNVTFTSVGYTIQVGKYTKVGNLVTVTGTIQTNSVVIGSAAGNVWITGLPFTQPSTDAPGGVNCFVAQSWAVDAPLAGYVFDSKIYLVERATSVSSSSLVSVADVATGGSNNLVRFSGHYYV